MSKIEVYGQVFLKLQGFLVRYLWALPSHKHIRTIGCVIELSHKVIVGYGRMLVGFLTSLLLQVSRQWSNSYARLFHDNVVVSSKQPKAH